MVRSMKRVKFDEFYSSDDHYFSQACSDGMVECLEQSKVFPCDALDIGAGEGRNSIYLASQGYKVTAVEPSILGAKKIVENAAKYGIDITVHNSDFLSVSKALHKYGFVLALTSLEHMEYEYLCKTITEIKRILTLNGYFYAIVFTEEDPGYTNDTINVSECAMFVQHYFKKNELLNFFSDFEIITYKEYVKEDTTHGLKHYHGKAKLFAKKVICDGEDECDAI